MKRIKRCKKNIHSVLGSLGVLIFCSKHLRISLIWPLERLFLSPMTSDIDSAWSRFLPSTWIFCTGKLCPGFTFYVASGGKLSGRCWLIWLDLRDTSSVIWFCSFILVLSKIEVKTKSWQGWMRVSRQHRFFKEKYIFWYRSLIFSCWLVDPINVPRTLWDQGVPFAS